MRKTSSTLGLAAGVLLFGFGLGGGSQAAPIQAPLPAHPATADSAAVTPAAYRCRWVRTYYGPRRVCRWVPGPRPYWGPPPPRPFPPPPPPRRFGPPPFGPPPFGPPPF